VVDIGPRYLLVEVTGPEEKVEAFIDMCRPYGVKDVVRTGLIAMPRHTRNQRENAKEKDHE
jgi:acetolactate synthase-1/3 small subunit